MGPSRTWEATPASASPPCTLPLSQGMLPQKIKPQMAQAWMGALIAPKAHHKRALEVQGEGSRPWGCFAWQQPPHIMALLMYKRSTARSWRVPGCCALPATAWMEWPGRPGWSFSSVKPSPIWRSPRGAWSPGKITPGTRHQASLLETL